ncbi:hypothetical protein [Burkholderia pseudomallei]|uniref:hypothetical protein n=1 Tax=Burkholderia pseudomallei TaxID=28450 RepID=UPI0012F4CC9D|nr:hypothetical protein [Burkholderia pseudomallei]
MHFDLKFVPAIALTVGITALFFTVMNYRRKAGIFVRGSFGFGSSVYGNDRYVHQIVLENLKDRAVTIFAIYIKIGHSYYIEIEDFEENPLMLKPFETYWKNYGPIEFYEVSMRQIKIDQLIQDNSIKKSIVLSTSDGRYVVPTHIPRWHPVGDFFKNYMTAIVRPVRATFDDKDLGANTRYVIELFHKDGRKETVLVHPGDFRVVMFRNFNLTWESLQSKEALEVHLKDGIEKGHLSCERFVVHDMDKWRTEAHKQYIKGPLVADYYNAFQYFVIGRIGTYLHNRKTRQANHAQQEAARASRSNSTLVRPTDE